MTLRPSIRATAFVLALGLAGCGGSHTGDTQSASLLPQAGSRHTQDIAGGIPTVTIRLFDAPLAGAKVFVALKSLAINAGTLSVPVANYPQPTVIELTALKETPLVFTAQAPAAKYDSLTFDFSIADSYVLYNGREISLARFIGAKKKNTDALVRVAIEEAGRDRSSAGIDIAVDFNVLESLQLLADGVQAASLNAKMVARQGGGAITGRVVNADGKPVADAAIVVSAADGHVANTSSTDADGRFRVNAVLPGTYTVAVQNSYRSASGTLLTAIGNTASAGPVLTGVSLGWKSITDLGTIAD